MAAIIVEDGTGLTNSNSYVSESELTTYATDRGITISGTNAVLLIQAMDYIELKDFKGVKNTDTQSLLWPRWGIFINDYYVDNNVIPDILKEALCEIALGIDGGNNPLANKGRETKVEKVGILSVTYMDGTRSLEYLTAAENKLKKIIKHGGINARTYRV